MVGVKFVTVSLVHLVSRSKGKRRRVVAHATSSKEALVVQARMVPASALMHLTTIATKRGGQHAVTTMVKIHALRVKDLSCVMSTVQTTLDMRGTVMDLLITIVIAMGGPSAARIIAIVHRRNLRARSASIFERIGARASH